MNEYGYVHYSMSHGLWGIQYTTDNHRASFTTRRPFCTEREGLKGGGCDQNYKMHYTAGLAATSVWMVELLRTSGAASKKVSEGDREGEEALTCFALCPGWLLLHQTKVLKWKKMSGLVQIYSLWCKCAPCKVERERTCKVCAWKPVMRGKCEFFLMNKTHF